MILRIYSFSIFNHIVMKMIAHPLKMIARSVKTQLLVILAIFLFTASCKKSNPGPFVTPVGLPPRIWVSIPLSLTGKKTGPPASITYMSPPTPPSPNH